MIEFVHALITVEGRYALQLRDAKTKTYPLRWSLFGGRVKKWNDGIPPSENPYDALVREIKEELELDASGAECFMECGPWQFYRKAFTLHEWMGHRLHEGLAVGLFDVTEALSVDTAPITKAVIWADIQIGEL